MCWSFCGGGRDVPRTSNERPAAKVSARFLLISDPPHGTVDAAEAAAYFGLTVAEVRMKANYGLPEIWFADETQGNRAAAAKELGLNAKYLLQLIKTLRIG